MKRLFQTQSPARLIALGFASVILIGSILLILPCSVQEGVALRYIDALYTSTSAVCVTGLIAVDAGDTFTPLGQFFLAMLIQVGGLGVTSVGAGIILAMGRKIDQKGRTLILEASNLNSRGGIIRFVQSVLRITLIFEMAGAALSFLVFVQDYPPLQALGISLFHSVAAFNNSGFDILGNLQNLIPYRNDIILNLVTCGLIFFGGIGFLVIREMWVHKLHWKKYSMHAKVVLTVSAALIVVGTILLKLTENITWLGALFHSVSARTAGFSTYSLGGFTNAGLLVLIVLMFIGASPGSTGGGIKTSTFFVLIQGIKSAATNKSEKAFRHAVPKDAFRKAAVITLLALAVVIGGTWLMLIMEPDVSLIDALFEITSAFGTVGLSTGITTGLGVGAKLLSILIMYIGRLGPLTVASLWYFTQGERVSFPEGNISIG
ncbi:MAG TPA: H(+)-transporting ATPase [Candidatus Faecousia intestinigallinarum]|nr:H(+)-transporting ATPase [Candidatus Faecousia intestinigallinarum]